MKIRFWITELDTFLWVDFPCRIFLGDEFFLDSLIEHSKSHLIKNKHLKEIRKDSNIYICVSSIFDSTLEDGIYQTAYIKIKE